MRDSKRCDKESIDVLLQEVVEISNILGAILIKLKK